MTRMPAPSTGAPAPARLLARAAGLLLGLVLLGAASAQTAQADPADPPGRVGSITLLAGPVTLIDLGTGTREDALLNWPLTGGWRIDAGRGGRAEVRVGSTVLRLDEDSTVDFVRLDDQFMQIAVLRGGVSLRLRSREIGNELELLTQRERIVFDDAGRYRIDVDRAPATTALAVFAGRARIASGGSIFLVSAGERGEVGTVPSFRYQVTAAVPDRFDDWVAARDARDDAIRSSAYVARETTGIEALDEYGDWRPIGEYGPVWFPRVVVDGWAPYRYGRWVWISPWGWTWIDDAPWGFAPLHYGRWVVVGGIWGWVPGIVVPRPIYAPALVGWYSAPVPRGGAPIGWFPLGPREHYVPPYRHSPRYLRVVNAQHVPNVASVTIVQTPRYAHREPDRSTWVPPDRFGRPGSVERDRRPPPSEWRQYIARPQPPANVPNTKRRQADEAAAPAPLPASPAAAPTVPAVRPPMVAPRHDEAPRAHDAPRPPVMPRAQPAPPRTVEGLPARSGPPLPSQPQPPPAAQPLPQSPPVAQPRAVPAAPAVQPAAPAMQPPAAQPPRGRVQPGATPDGRRQAPRGIEAPAATSPSPPPGTAPAPNDPARGAGGPPAAAQPAPPPRTDGGPPRGGDRGGRSPVEATR